MAYGRINGENILRRDAEEAVRMAGLDPIVNVLVNTRRGFDTPLRRGVVEAQRKCVEVARTHCLTQVEFDFDVVVANAYSKASEATIAAWTAVCLKEGGVLVLIHNARSGQVSHYVHGRWGVFAERAGRFTDVANRCGEPVSP